MNTRYVVCLQTMNTTGYKSRGVMQGNQIYVIKGDYLVRLAAAHRSPGTSGLSSAV